VLTTVVLVYISLFDIKNHRIQNLALALLTIVAMFDPRHSVNLLLAVITLLFGYFLYRFLSVGAGDIKLITVLVLFLIPATAIETFWIYFSLFAIVLITFLRKSATSHQGHIPLAPALCGAVLCVIGLW
jgi:Flp pilus assembly protein protease CpaA